MLSTKFMRNLIFDYGLNKLKNFITNGGYSIFINNIKLKIYEISKYFIKKFGSLKISKKIVAEVRVV